MSRQSKRLRRAFEIEVSETRLRGLTAFARAKVIESATRKMERGVNEDLQREVEQAQKRQENILKRREEENAKKAKKAEVAQQKRDRKEAELQHQQRCTCRRPVLDRNGKCTRCKKVPAGRKGMN